MYGVKVETYQSNQRGIVAILNYTTSISSDKTVSEIQAKLGNAGAQSVSTQFIKGRPSAIFFALEIGEQLINFRLPCNVQGVLGSLESDSKVPWRLKTTEQAEKVSWRIIKDWVEAQLAIIESGQAQMAEVFLPYAITSNGQTCFERMATNPQLLLGQ